MTIQGEPRAVAGGGDLPGGGTPEGERLARAHRAFDVGDFAEVRRLCGELVDADAEIADASRALRRRVSIDPFQIAVIVGCFALFVLVVLRYAT